MRIKSLLFTAFFALAGVAGVADAYPSAGAAPDDGCAACHDNPDFKGKLVVKLLRVKGGEKVVDDYDPGTNTIRIPMKKGSSISYKLVLGHSEAGKARAVGWLWKLPAGAETQLINCVRRLEQGQPWTKYTGVDGENHDVKHHTVAGQTFYFSGAVPDAELAGELRVSLGLDGQGPEKLAGHTIKVVFYPSAE